MNSNVDQIKEKSIANTSRIRSFSPFVGPRGLLRSTGRTKRLDAIEFDTKHPIILDGLHPVVPLMLENLHKCHHHQGLDFMRSQVQQRFAVLRLRQMLRKVETECLVCRKRKAQTLTPMMADLPKERLAFQSPPFTMTGVDYFGPFFVKVRRSSEKRWAFLLTCLTTRAVHLEIVSSLDTSACVMGIERFIARRGTPSVIWSDNGTIFVGAEKELRTCIQCWNQQAPSIMVHKKLTWKFNPSGSPHQGGSWERLVRSCKRVFYAILGNRKLTEDVLLTTFCLVEQTLNARPLTPVSSDPNEFDALCPNYFLLGRPSSSLPSINPAVNDFDHRKRFARAQAYANAIWSRWIKEYVPVLNQRGKWHSDSDRHLKAGDLVWIIDPTAPRGFYPTARVESLNYGSDGIARSANLRTKHSLYTRPLVKIVPLFEPSSSGAEDVDNQCLSTIESGQI